jgi:hypothetical protein
MNQFAKNRAIGLLFSLLLMFPACGKRGDETVQNNANVLPTATINANNEVKVDKTPKFPNLQIEILDRKHSTSNTPIGKFDFKNYTYPLPRGWQDKDSKDITLENGSRRMSEDQIGMSYVTTKFGDVTGDGQDEAFVILKIVTAGAAIPQSVNVFTWKNDAPELIWTFRTGDRTDGGLKNVYAENGEVVVELYGQDRFILGEVETSKITGDEEQLCCPDFFTRTRYKWNGRNFLMQGKRETRSITAPNAPPVENKGDLINEQNKRQK